MKRIAIFIAALILFSVFAGCGNPRLAENGNESVSALLEGEITQPEQNRPAETAKEGTVSAIAETNGSRDKAESKYTSPATNLTETDSSESKSNPDAASSKQTGAAMENNIPSAME